MTTVLLPLIIMKGLLIWGILLLLSGEQTPFAQLLIYGSAILLFFSIIGIHTPGWIKLDDEKIILHAFLLHMSSTGKNYLLFNYEYTNKQVNYISGLGQINSSKGATG